MSDMGLARPGEKKPEKRGNIGDRAHRGMGTAAQPLLIDDDRHTEMFDRICLRLWNTGHKTADERAEIFVQQTLRFGGDGIEYDG